MKCPSIERINELLRHFRAEVAEHEGLRYSSRRASAQCEHRGQEIAYRHIVRHLEALLKEFE